MARMFLLGLVIIALAMPVTKGYTELFDNVDVDKILADDALFIESIECVLDKGPCSTDLLKELKKIVPEIISTACEKCSNSEKAKVRKLVHAIYERKPNMAVEFHKKYDPTGDYEAKFAAFLMTKDD